MGQTHGQVLLSQSIQATLLLPILEAIFYGNNINNPNQEPNGSYNPLNDPGNYQSVEVAVMLPVNGQSDGLVPIYSAQLHPRGN